MLLHFIPISLTVIVFVWYNFEYLDKGVKLMILYQVQSPNKTMNFNFFIKKYYSTLNILPMPSELPINYIQDMQIGTVCWYLFDVPYHILVYPHVQMKVL